MQLNLALFFGVMIHVRLVLTTILTLATHVVRGNDHCHVVSVGCSATLDAVSVFGFYVMWYRATTLYEHPFLSSLNTLPVRIVCKASLVITVLKSTAKTALFVTTNKFEFKKGVGCVETPLIENTAYYSLALNLVGLLGFCFGIFLFVWPLYAYYRKWQKTRTKIQSSAGKRLVQLVKVNSAGLFVFLLLLLAVVFLNAAVSLRGWRNYWTYSANNFLMVGLGVIISFGFGDFHLHCVYLMRR